MSKSRYYLICIILADLIGIALSYLYGATIPAWIGSWLPAKLEFLRTAALWLYQRPLLLLPHTWQMTLMRQAGLYWLCCTLLAHLWLLILYPLRRYTEPDNLGKPHPGGPYWETVQDLFKSYREAMQRWKPKWALKTPTWRYYKRQDSTQPDIYWRGRILVIERGMFAPDRREELAIALARELMYYNSDDIWVKAILSYYPRGWLLPLFLSGLCILLPAVLIKEIGWSSHWEKRTLVADRFAYLVGQGLLLFQQILLRLRETDHVPQLRRDLAVDLEELIPKRDALQQQINNHKARLIEKYRREHQHYQSYHQYGYHDSGYPSSLFQPDQGQQQGQSTVVVPEDDALHQMRQERNQMNVSITDLQQRIEQLTIQEQQSFAIRPILEERLEQIAALLNTERQWMQQRGISIPSNYPAIAFSAPSARNAQQNALEVLWEGNAGKEES